LSQNPYDFAANKSKPRRDLARRKSIAHDYRVMGMVVEYAAIHLKKLSPNSNQ
jgi:hypothetical protein